MAAPTLAAHVTPIDAGAPVAAVGFLGPVPALALDDGHVMLAVPHGVLRVAAHPGASVFFAAAAGDKFVTGGDDGRVAAIWTLLKASPRSGISDSIVRDGSERILCGDSLDFLM